MPERRCILTHESLPADQLVRCVIGPDETLVPDVAAKLPGRGIWVKPDGEAIRAALKNGRFAKAVARSLKAPVPRRTVSDEIDEQIKGLLVRRCLDRVGLVQKAGDLVTGFDKIKAALAKKGAAAPALVLAAKDGAADGRRKIQSTVGRDVPVFDWFDREQLSRALGRDNVVHVLLFESGGTEKLKADIGRLSGMLNHQFADAEGDAAQRNEE